MKKTLLILTFFTVAVFATSAMADTIGWSGRYTISGSGNGTVTLTFNSGRINSATNPDSTEDVSLETNGLANYSVTLSPSASSTTTFDVTTLLFSPGSTSLTLGDSVDGSTTGTLSYLNLMSIGGGNFAIGLSFANATYTIGSGGADATLQSISLPNGGSGSLTYQFHVDGINNVADLGTFNGSSSSTYSASLNAVPEPGSLALFGSGLLMGGNFIRRKINA